MREIHGRTIPLFGIFCSGIFLLFGGCSAVQMGQERICPGKESAVDAVISLRANSENAAAFRASGQCTLEYYADNKEHKENFPVKLWVKPPSKIYVQGELAFDPKGFVLGANEEEFWLLLKPKEISSYCWGRREEGRNASGLMVNPQQLIEVLGIMDTGQAGGWQLSNKDGFDIFTVQSGAVEIKKIYIYACDYKVSRIEYLNAAGGTDIIAEMDRYRGIGDNFSVPSFIRIAGPDKEDKKRQVGITLNLSSVRRTDFTGVQEISMFTRPQSDGFKHVFKITNGEVTEQKQQEKRQ